jgi:predicted MFS family arabinose efflux permease
MRSFSRMGLGAVSAAVMATATFPIIAASVLAAQLIDEFSISRAQIGLLATGSGLVGALASPFFGRLTDRLGAVRSIIGVLVGGSIALSVFALSPSYGVLLSAAFLSGLPNGWGNPATNALIVDNVPPGARGLVTGVKQSGVQIGTFLGGLLLPLFAVWWSWRVALLAFLAMPLSGLISMIGRRNVERQRPAGSWSSRGPLPTVVRWITVYGFISGTASSALVAFLPLFANEVGGWSESAAGTLIAVVGIAGVAARIYWPRLAERSTGHAWTLRVLSWMTMLTGLLLVATDLGWVPGWALVPAALLLGGGAVAWNSVGMLAVMDLVPHDMVGKGTGLVLLGFLLGLAIGAPLMGLSVDILGSYWPGWMATAGLLAVSGLLAFKVPSDTMATAPS